MDVIVSGGIEIYGSKATAISRRITQAEPVHEKYTFIAHRDNEIITLKEAVTISIHIALECYNLINVKVLEYIDENDKVLQEDLIIPIVQEVLNNLPLVRSNLTLAAPIDRFDSSILPPYLSIMQLNKFTKDDTFLMIVAVGILTKGICNTTNQLVSKLMEGGFLLSRENINNTYDYALLQRFNLNIILEKRTEREALILMKKAQSTMKQQKIVYINNHELLWIDKLKSVMDKEDKSETKNTRIIVVAQNNFECGILGLVQCLRKEPGGERVSCVFIQDTNAPEFSLQEPFYMEQLKLDLPINILRSDKVWGSYRHLLLPRPQPRPVQYGYVAQKVY